MAKFRGKQAWENERRGMQPLLVFAGALAVALLLRHLLLRLIRRQIPKGSTLAEVFVLAAGTPSVLWCFAVATAIAIHNSTLTTSQLYWAERAIAAFLIPSFSLVAASVLVRLIGVYGERNSLPFAVAGLSRTLVYVVVLSVGALVLLRLFGLEITPLLTALGVGGLAVALALQDTLANLFAGIHILVEEPLRVGHQIRLSSEEEGVVRDIGWRTTRILNGSNNVIVIPNTKITSGILTNFSLPDSRVAADISVRTSHEADPETVMRIVLEAVRNVPGILSEPAPTIAFDPGALETHLEFKLSVHLPSQVGAGMVKSGIRLQIWRTLRGAGVPMPSGEKIAILREE